MTTNEPPNQLEWSIRARWEEDSGQWDWGMKDRGGRDSAVSNPGRGLDLGQPMHE